MQHVAAFGGEEELRKTFGGTEGNGGWREASAGWREASAEPKLTEKEEDLRRNRRERWLEGGFGGTEAY